MCVWECAAEGREVSWLGGSFKQLYSLVWKGGDVHTSAFSSTLQYSPLGGVISRKLCTVVALNEAAGKTVCPPLLGVVR